MSGSIRNRNRSREATTHGLREAKARANREVSMSNVGVGQFVVYQCGINVEEQVSGVQENEK